MIYHAEPIMVTNWETILSLFELQKEENQMIPFYYPEISPIIPVFLNVPSLIIDTSPKIVGILSTIKLSDFNKPYVLIEISSEIIKDSFVFELKIVHEQNMVELFALNNSNGDVKSIVLIN